MKNIRKWLTSYFWVNITNFKFANEREKLAILKIHIFLFLVNLFSVLIILFDLFIKWNFTSRDFLATYFLMLVFFHTTEFNFVFKFHPNQLSSRSFLLHNPFYLLALFISLVEFYYREGFFSSATSNLDLYSIIGFVLVIGGEIIRILALNTAKSNFTHKVATGIFFFFFQLSKMEL